MLSSQTRGMPNPTGVSGGGPALATGRRAGRGWAPVGSEVPGAGSAGGRAPRQASAASGLESPRFSGAPPRQSIGVLPTYQPSRRRIDRNAAIGDDPAHGVTMTLANLSKQSVDVSPTSAVNWDFAAKKQD
ncbi:hypothetical protein A176_007432 [Myxococcus hansupus]|uniref:Uncharacterized protein n=1 Tax=Pseudomyxococcus hansupus TaxID=1297742 RepID=A0A0H4XA68_9BACT|nr:hypothetical protein A176_007432 [Myxococcus hansupus]